MNSLQNNWIALIEQDKIDEALKEFSSFLDNNSSPFNTDKEISKKLLVEKLKEKYNSYFENKDYKNAYLCCKYIFKYFPKVEENLNNYINVLDLTKQYKLKLSVAKYYLYAYKKNICYKILSKAFFDNQEYEQALNYFEKFLELENKKELEADEYNYYGCIYDHLYKSSHNPKDAQNALDLFIKAIKLSPKNKEYLKNAIFAAMNCKNFTIEKSLWDNFFSYNYADIEYEFIYSTECMKYGDIDTWNKYYDSRFYTKNPTIYPKFEKPRLIGKENLSDKTLLIPYEQGFGDTILCFGFMPRLVKIANHVIFYCQNEIYELLKDNEYGVEIQCPNKTDVNKLTFDYHIPCMSIPAVLKLNKNNISVGGCYIKPDKNRVEKFKNRYFLNNKYKIGISYSSSKDKISKLRDIPIENLLKLEKIDNVQLYNFAKDIDYEIFDKFTKNKVINVVKDCNNFADTAAALENVDILISSDNVILNLAGAIGKKTLGLFNYNYIYRWYDLSGEDCGWYKSVKPIVNNEYNDWNLSMDKAIEIIKQEMNK